MCLKLRGDQWCSGGDLNPHALRHTPLKRTCLPFHHPSWFKGEKCLTRPTAVARQIIARGEVLHPQGLEGSSFGPCLTTPPEILTSRAWPQNVKAGGSRKLPLMCQLRTNSPNAARSGACRRSREPLAVNSQSCLVIKHLQAVGGNVYSFLRYQRRLDSLARPSQVECFPPIP